MTKVLLSINTFHSIPLAKKSGVIIAIDIIKLKY
jgi:hypothetical protein